MNYIKAYNSIINRAKQRQISEYTERHHIVPKCVGGSNDKSNIVRLTAREHFVCHLLLVEIYPESSKLKYAVWAMANQETSKQQRTYKVSSRLYERLKTEFALLNSKHHRGSKRTLEQREKMVKTRTGVKRGSYKPKELKFEHRCENCNQVYKSADAKGTFCKLCKEPRLCKCGCGKIVKTPGKEYYRGCRTRGKTYLNIYGTEYPSCGFKKGNHFGKK